LKKKVVACCARPAGVGKSGCIVRIGCAAHSHDGAWDGSERGGGRRGGLGVREQEEGSSRSKVQAEGM